VIASRTGAVLRTLASDVALEAPGLPNLSVSATGTVYFDSATTDPATGADQIYRVPITGGPVTRVTAGFDPQISPNGRFLAYVAPEPNEQIPYLDPAGGIDVAAISGSSLGPVRTLGPDTQQLNRGIFQLSWSPDSRELSFGLLNGTTDVTTFWTIDPRSSTNLAAAKPIALRNPSLTWNGYWGHGHTTGLGVLTAVSGAQRVVTINPATGKRGTTLFKVPGGVCVALSPSSPPISDAALHSPCSYDFDNAIISDPGASDVLIGGATHVIASTGGQSAPYLYRWRLATRVPVRLTPNVLLATWGPSR
jgi:hypothetical protein